MPYVLAIDFGTSGCRSAIYNEKLEMLYAAVAEYPLIVLSEKEIEQDADLWWQRARETMCEALSKGGVDPKAIRAISISSQGIAFVPLDEKGNTMGNAISWLDGRAEEEIALLDEKYGLEMLYNRTGKRLSPPYTLSKLLWFKKHRQEIYEKAWKILLPMDFIQFRLSGKCVTDHTMAAGTMFYDVVKQQWDEEILAENGLDIRKLPDISWAGAPIGTILPEVAQELGLSPDTLIVNGAQDQKCAALGAGAAADVAAISLGTGSCIAQLSTTPIPDPGLRIPFFSYVQPGLWDLEGVISTAGSAYNWFCREFGGGRSFDELNALAAQVKLPNAAMFYPYLAGGSSPYWGDPTGCFIGLSLNTGLGHCARAVMEGIAYNIRENLDIMAQVSIKAKQLRLYGGGSKSDLWCQIIADITGIPVVRLSSSETALAGAAKLAFLPLEIPTPPFLSVAEQFLPDPEASAIYEKAYEKYEQLRKVCFD